MVIHGNKLRWLFWLRWKMFTRGFTKNVARIIGTIILFLSVLFLGVSVAAGTFFGYRYAPAPLNMELLSLVLTGVYILWIILPLLEFTTNEGLDISKLALFPLTRGELMASLIISTLLDIPTLGLVLVLGAVVAGWATSVSMGIMAFVVMLVFYVQIIAFSQLILALLQKVLQSRRFRDLSIILVVLLSSSGYIINLAARSLVTRNSVDALEHGTISSYLQWLPSGMAAHSIQQASLGNWGISLMWLLALIVLSAIFLFCWQLVVERGLTAAESGSKAKRAHSQRARTVATTGTVSRESDILSHILPQQVRSLIVKDLKYFWRDPQIKAIFLQSLLSMAFLIVYFGFNFVSSSSRGTSFLVILGPLSMLFIPAFVLLSLFSLAYNVLGLERQSITTLFLFPINPKYILFGKNIAVFAVGLVEVTILILLAAVLTHAWAFLPASFTVGLSGIFITLAIGNFTSVFLPQKMRLARRGFQTSANTTSSAGCLRSLLTMVSFWIMLILLIPIAAAAILPVLFHVQLLWAATLPLSLCYGAALYYITTILVAPRILLKAPEIVNAIAKE